MVQGIKVCKFTTECDCDNLYKGPTCNILRCHDRGNSTDEGCDCYSGWTGEHCEERQCTPGQGVASGDRCICKKGFSGKNCEGRECPFGCSGNGNCSLSGSCECDYGWTGNGCQIRRCPNECSGHGFCEGYAGNCTCIAGWILGLDADCSVRANCVDLGCNGRGVCKVNDTIPECDCKRGWTGVSCDTRTCPHNCSNHGKCTNGTCECFQGFTGKTCSVARCPNDCGGHGKCRLMHENNTDRVYGACQCDKT